MRTLTSPTTAETQIYVNRSPQVHHPELLTELSGILQASGPGTFTTDESFELIMNYIGKPGSYVERAEEATFQSKLGSREIQDFDINLVVLASLQEPGLSPGGELRMHTESSKPYLPGVRISFLAAGNRPPHYGSYDAPVISMKTAYPEGEDGEYVHAGGMQWTSQEAQGAVYRHLIEIMAGIFHPDSVK